jgi:hypothetical protein
MSQVNSGQFTNFVATNNLTATITVGQTVSGAVDLSATFLTALIIPANFDGTQITFQVSNDGTSFYAYRNTSNTIVTVTVTPDSAMGIVPSDFASWRYIKIVSVTTQTTTDTVIGLVTRPLV